MIWEISYGTLNTAKFREKRAGHRRFYFGMFVDGVTGGVVTGFGVGFDFDFDSLFLTSSFFSFFTSL